MCLNTDTESFTRVHVVIVVLQNNLPIFLKDALFAHGYQVQYITFKNVPMDAVGSAFVVNCPELVATQQNSCMLIQTPPFNTQTFTSTIVSWPQAMINDHQFFPLICFEESRYLNQLKFAIGNEVGEYDATQINSTSRFTIGIDFFVKNKNPC